MSDILGRIRPLRSSVPLLVFCVWFVAAYGMIVWAWGVDPVIFPTPDEALCRLAARLIHDHGTPFLTLPFADPEDLAHPRNWLSLGERAVPTYAPFLLYVYGYLLHLGRVGLLFTVAFPASAAGAFAAGTAKLLPKGRQWLGLLAPALGFPALFWLLRPWMNLSPVLGCLAWGFFAWASWSPTKPERAIAGAFAGVAFATAIRPDYAPFLLLAGLLVLLAASPASWRTTLTCGVAAGAFALGVNLALNRVITGHAFQAAYQMSVDREYGAPSNTNPVVRILQTLLTPMGLPAPHEAAREFLRYCVYMGPVSLLLFGQASIVPLVERKPLLVRLAIGALVLVVIAFAISRMIPGLYGSMKGTPGVFHSIPRYMSPIYLFAALPPLLFLGGAKRGPYLYLGILLALVLATSGLYEITVREEGSFARLRPSMRSKALVLQQLELIIPGNSIVYSTSDDKSLWSRFRVGLISDPKPTADSINRALDAKIPVYFVDFNLTSPVRGVLNQLRASGFTVVQALPRRHLFRVTRSAAN